MGKIRENSGKKFSSCVIIFWFCVKWYMVNWNLFHFLWKNVFSDYCCSWQNFYVWLIKTLIVISIYILQDENWTWVPSKFILLLFYKVYHQSGWSCNPRLKLQKNTFCSKNVNINIIDVLTGNTEYLSIVCIIWLTQTKKTFDSTNSYPFDFSWNFSLGWQLHPDWR